MGTEEANRRVGYMGTELDFGMLAYMENAAAPDIFLKLELVRARDNTRSSATLSLELVRIRSDLCLHLPPHIYTHRLDTFIPTDSSILV